ncbi:unnamed protein product [Lota lota]
MKQLQNSSFSSAHRCSAADRVASVAVTPASAVREHVKTSHKVSCCCEMEEGTVDAPGWIDSPFLAVIRRRGFTKKRQDDG